MKRTLWMTIVVVALAGVVAIPMTAQQRQGRGFGPGMGMGPGEGRGPGGPGRMGGGPMALLRGIQLTDAQREQIRAIMDEHREDAPDGKVRDLNEQLQLAILADTPDTAKIDELKTAIAAGAAEALARRVDVESKVVQILTPAQRAQARKNVSKVGPPQRRGR